MARLKKRVRKRAGARLIRPTTDSQKALAFARRADAVGRTVPTLRRRLQRQRAYRKKPCKNGASKRGPLVWKSGRLKGRTYYTCRQKKS